MEQYLTSEQVAKLLQVHQFTVLKYLKQGRIKGVKIGRVYRIKESEVEKFLNRVSTTVEIKEPTEAPAEVKKPKPQQKEESDEYFKLL